MLENYEEKVHVTLNDMKDYFYAIDPCYDTDLEYCTRIKEFRQVINENRFHYFHLALDDLHRINNFDDFEDHLIMMNEFFGDLAMMKQEKVNLKHALLKSGDAINQYRLLRHIMIIDRKELIDKLYQRHYITLEQAAYFCLIEEYVDEAYHYLMQMDHLPCDPILDLLSSYSMVRYLKLIHHDYVSHPSKPVVSDEQAYQIRYS